MFRSGLFRFFRLLMVTSFMFSLAGALGVHSAQAQTDARCFPETGQCISGRFREYWEQNGGLAVFGYPISPVRDELNRDTNRTYQTQWFERNRFELHPENARPYDVLLGRLGDDLLQANGRDWRSEGRESGPKAGCIWFAATGHNVCDQESGVGFKTYWSTHGLEFDGQRGTSYQESLALFGLPLTEPRMETNSSGDRVLTQWFERARFEYHPNKPQAYKVLLGLLGREIRGSTPVASLPLDAPWIHNGNQVAAAAGGAPAVNLAQTTQHGAPWHVAAAPNGSYVAYAENITSGSQQLGVLNMTTGARQTYSVNNGIILGMVFSPNSRQLAYTVILNPNQAEPRYELRILDVAAGTTAVRATGSSRSTPVVTTWNGSGLYAQQILYQTDAPSQGVVQIDPNTGSMEQIVSGNNHGSAISPDGRSLALVTGDVAPGPGTPRTQLAVRNRQTGRDTVIVPTGSYYIGDPQWNPSGTKIVYRRYVENVPGAESIRVLNADGSGEQSIRLDTGAFPGQLLDVAWRSDGTLLILTKDGPSKITVFELSLSNFHAAAAKTLQTFQVNGEVGHQFVYIPR